MKVTVVFEQDINEDGVDGTVMVQKDGVEDTYDLLALFSQSARAGGFSYWDRTAYATERGEITWETF